MQHTARKKGNRTSRGTFFRIWGVAFSPAGERGGAMPSMTFDWPSDEQEQAFVGDVLALACNGSLQLVQLRQGSDFYEKKKEHESSSMT